jgi:hypothetical protein
VRAIADRELRLAAGVRRAASEQSLYSSASLWRQPDFASHTTEAHFMRIGFGAAIRESVNRLDSWLHVRAAVWVNQESL